MFSRVIDEISMDHSLFVWKNNSYTLVMQTLIVDLLVFSGGTFVYLGGSPEPRGTPPLSGYALSRIV